MESRKQCVKCNQIQTVITNVTGIESIIRKWNCKHDIAVIMLLQNESCMGIMKSYTDLFCVHNNMKLTKPEWDKYITSNCRNSPPAFRKTLASLDNTLCISLQSSHGPPDY